MYIYLIKCLHDFQDFEIKHQRRRFNGETKNTFRKAYNKLQKSCSIE